MRIREHHRHLHARATTSNDSSLPADSARRACTSAQQAAAAWAWFEHGGSSCITPSKAQGLAAAAKGRANSVGAGPSRFKKEALISSAVKIPQHQAGSADDHHVLSTKFGRAASRRRHSFDQHCDQADRTWNLYDQSFSSSFRSTSTAPCFHVDDGAVDDQDVGGDEKGRNTNSACQNEACSLLDKFEVEAVWKQLHDRFRPSRKSPCSRAESQEYPRSPKTHHHHHPQDHPKSHPYIKSCSTSTHKLSADNDHRHSMNYVVRRLLHMHMKVSSGHSTAAGPAPPFFCSSIATANSIIDHHHHHRRSPKRSKAEKRPQDVLHKLGMAENVGKVLNQVSSIAEKVSVEHGDELSREDGVLALMRSNRHSHLHGDHVLHHVHHHHHHYYHQTNNEAFKQGARHLLRDYHGKGRTGAHDLQAPKIYRLHKDSKLAISGVADHQEAAHLQHHEYAAVPGQQTAAKFKAEKYLWPAARTDRVDLQAL